MESERHTKLIDKERPSKRTPSLDTADRQRNAILVAPFLRQFGRWQERAAHVGGLIEAGRMDQAQFLSTALELDELVGEVAATREMFAEAAIDKLRWSRVRDVTMALERLASRLGGLREQLAKRHPPEDPLAVSIYSGPRGTSQ